MRRTVVALVCGVVAWAAVFPDAGISARVTATSITTSASARAARAHWEARILAWVVERYPDATTKDFLAFPAVLLDASERAGIDYRLILAMADKESGMNPRAVGRDGEVGLLQLLPSTAALVAKRLGDTSYESPVASKDTDGRSRYSLLGSLADPKVNVRYGIEYLRWQVQRLGMTPTALRAYNRGPARAHESWLTDRYAEDVALDYFALVQHFDSPAGDANDAQRAFGAAGSALPSHGARSLAPALAEAAGAVLDSGGDQPAEGKPARPVDRNAMGPL